MKIHVNIDHILEGWKYAHHAGETSVGRIAPWGGHYICIIHDDVPEDERQEVARFIAEAPEKIKNLESIIEEIRDIHTDEKYFDEIDRDIKVDEILARWQSSKQK